MHSVFFPQEAHFRHATGSFRSSVSSIKEDCFLYIIKHFPTLDNEIFTELIVEKYMETVHDLISERYWEK